MKTHLILFPLDAGLPFALFSDGESWGVWYCWAGAGLSRGDSGAAGRFLRRANDSGDWGAEEGGFKGKPSPLTAGLRPEPGLEFWCWCTFAWYAELDVGLLE